LAKAIKTPPIQLKGAHGKLLLKLVKLWPIGLCRLEIKELIGLLDGNGLTIQEDIDAFRKYVNKLKNSNVLFNLDKLIND